MTSYHLITLGEMLTHPNEEIRRHANGARKAIERELTSLRAEQTATLSGITMHVCEDCGAPNMPARSACRNCGHRLHL
jgi:uncharacterized OB-fold protein